MLPTIDVPEPIEQTASGRAGVPAAGAAAAAGSGGRGGGAATPTSGFAGVGGGASGLPLKLLSMSLPLLLVGIPAFRHDAVQASASRRRATFRISLRHCPQRREATTAIG